MPYTYYESPEHGWVEVTLSELEILGIIDRISGYSYTDKEYVYLEEDADLTTFLKVRAATGRAIAPDDLNRVWVENFPHRSNIIRIDNLSSDYADEYEEDYEEANDSSHASDVTYVIGPPGPPQLKVEYMKRAASIGCPAQDFYLELMQNALRQMTVRALGEASTLEKIIDELTGLQVVIVDPMLTYYQDAEARHPALMLRADALYTVEGERLDASAAECIIRADIASVLGYLLKSEWVNTVTGSFSTTPDAHRAAKVPLASLIGRTWQDEVVRLFVDQYAPVTGLELKTGSIFEAKKFGIKIYLGRTEDRAYVEKVYAHLSSNGSAYAEELPFSLQASDTTQTVQRKLGKPTNSANPYMYAVPEGLPPGIHVSMDGSDEAWDEYKFTKISSYCVTDTITYSMRVKYTVDYSCQERVLDYKNQEMILYGTGVLAGVDFSVSSAKALI